MGEAEIMNKSMKKRTTWRKSKGGDGRRHRPTAAAVAAPQRVSPGRVQQMQGLIAQVILRGKTFTVRYDYARDPARHTNGVSFWEFPSVTPYTIQTMRLTDDERDSIAEQLCGDFSRRR